MLTGGGRGLLVPVNPDSRKGVGEPRDGVLKAILLALRIPSAHLSCLALSVLITFTDTCQIHYKI